MKMRYMQFMLSSGERLCRTVKTAVLLLLGLGLTPLGQAEQNYLDPSQAFRLSASVVDSRTVEVSYKIAPGYYLYREQFAFKAEGAKLGAAVFPKGLVKYDETFQKDVESYRDTASIRMPLETTGPFKLTVTSQGCADAGLCYSPVNATLELIPFTGSIGQATVATGAGQAKQSTAAAETTDDRSGMGRIEASLRSGNLLAILSLFLVLGFGLAFTPCVLPMVPILSSIIVGEGTRSRGRGLLLSATYSLGMAIVYTLLGVGAGLAGEGLAASLQNAWVLSAFALLMVALSLSMFGMYQFQMPAVIQEKLLMASAQQPAGKLAGVFLMGALSALIVGPCVAAPLAGALVYISQTRDILIGGGALFAMAIGMSVPLLLIGASAGALLPRAGAWMDAVKRFFGVLMLATALWMVAPLLPTLTQMAGWALLGIGYAAYLLRNKGGWLAKAVAIIFAGFGMVQLAGLATGGQDPWAPLAHLQGAPPQHAKFVRIKSVDELDASLRENAGKTVVLDFYADWCVSCKEMEKRTFADPRVQNVFADMVLLQADVTANNDDDKALLKRFQLFGPPGIIFFNNQGQEIGNSRVIGFQEAAKFLQSLSRLQPT